MKALSSLSTNMLMRIAASFGLALFLLFSVGVKASNNKTSPNLLSIDSGSIDTFTPALLRSTADPKYPMEAVRRSQEGWVRISYVVGADGKVIDPIIEDYVGNSRFKKAALRAVKRWRYEPALLNGQPVEQADKVIQIQFALDPPSKGASPKFARLAKKIIRLAEEDPNYNAKDHLSHLRKKVNSLYEDAWYWWLLGQYYVQQKQAENTVRALSRSIAYDGKYLHESLYDVAAKQLSNAKSQRALKEIGLTLDYNQHLKQTRLDDSKSKPIASMVNAKVGPNELWTYRILGTELTFDKVKGSLRDLEVRCTRGRVKITSLKTPIKVPYSLGDCTLYLQGRAGTSFQMRERVTTL